MPVEKTPAPCRTAARHARTTAHGGAGRFFGTAAKGSRTAPQGKRSPAPRTDVPDAPSPCCVASRRTMGRFPVRTFRLRENGPAQQNPHLLYTEPARTDGPSFAAPGRGIGAPAPPIAGRRVAARNDSANRRGTGSGDRHGERRPGGRQAKARNRPEQRKNAEHTGKRFIFRTFVHRSSVRHRTARAPAERAAAPADRSAKPESHT